MDHHPAAPHEAQGRHLLLTLSGCPAARLDDEEALRRMVCEAVAAAGATLLQLSSHRFSPAGVTVLALLAESHAGLHTYPEQGTAFLDCFTCGQQCDPRRTIQVLTAALAPGRITEALVSRSPGDRG